MRVTTGRVVNAKIEVPGGGLHERMVVKSLAQEDRETFTLGPEDEAHLMPPLSKQTARAPLKKEVVAGTAQRLKFTYLCGNPRAPRNAGAYNEGSSSTGALRNGRPQKVKLGAPSDAAAHKGLSTMSKKKKRHQRKSDAQFSSLDVHKKVGKSFVPPLLGLPQLKTQSWINNRLPEMLWVALLIKHLGRDWGLNIIRRVATYGRELRQLDKPLDITLSDISNWPTDWRRELLSIITTKAEPKRALRPLLLFHDLPAKDDWAQAIGVQPLPFKDWPALAEAVASVLRHQSQEATDCRWARLVFQIALGRFIFPHSAKNEAEELLLYPNQGDQRAVRPSIRAAELGLDAAQDSPRPWPEHFWSQCLQETGCQPLPSESLSPTPVITPEEIGSLYTAVCSWSDRTRSTTAVDPKHETTIGSALFAIAILAEICEPGVSQSILGRSALRTLLELQLTLAYLAKMDDAELWRSHRTFGAGQAKLQFLHLERLGREPTFVDINTLEALANEDQWQEFLKIDVGHWARLNLRELSTAANLKADYDSVYPWTSTYVHGHWGAIRDSVYGICLNPLHRFHRIPLERPRPLDPVLKEAAELMNKILAIAQSVYPQAPLNVNDDREGGATRIP